MEPENKPERTWYERVFETTDLNFSNPKLDPYLNVEKYPDWVTNIMIELSRQGLHLSPIRAMKEITPKKLGMNLGQKCANFYAIQNFVQAGLSAMENPQHAEKVVAMLEKFEEEKKNPAVASTLHAMEVTGALVEELENDSDKFEKIVHNAFREALDQPDYGEAVQFFQGFAQGISSPGIVAGKLAQNTDATSIYSRMFYHWQEVDQLGTVVALYDFLLKRGFTEQTLGGIERLKTICKRIRYAPGKRKHQSKAQN